jgi:starvation-inducible outer membrane lipoprotein
MTTTRTIILAIASIMLCGCSTAPVGQKMSSTKMSSTAVSIEPAIIMLPGVVALVGEMICK